MANENCILLSNSRALDKVHERMSFAFGEKAFQMEGEPSEWRKISMTRRKLFRQATVTFTPLEDVGLKEIQKRLQHVFKSVPAENPGIQTKLLAKIATSRLAVDVQAPGGLRGLEDVVFAMAESLDALIFWQGNKMLDKTGKIVMDFQGRSGVADLDVVVDAAILDSHTPVTESGKARKQKTEAVLKQRKIPYASSLPPIDGDEHVRIRSLKDVAGRALALMLVAVKGEGLEQEIVLRVMNDFGIGEFLTPNERAFIDNLDPPQQDRVNFCWRYESLWVMLWALGQIDELPFPDQICDVARSVTLIRESKSQEGFIAASRLRSPSEILDQCDLAYRLNWAVTNARLRGDIPPANMEPGVVFERHYALNWLRCYFDAEWDDVGTDT